MTLQFESLTLKNFGPYRDVPDLALSTTAESPVVVVHGENTLGKTSLFRALRWCLYGAPEAGKTERESARYLIDYLNRPAHAEGDSTMQVGIKFTNDGQAYSLTRTARFDGGSPSVQADLRVGADVWPAAGIDAEIGRLLHPQISEFFLFDGELLRDFYEKLNSNHERDLLRRSIERVLGIPALQRAADDISVLTDEVITRQTKALKSRKAAEDVRRKQLALNSKRESLEKDRTNIEQAKRKAQADLIEIRDQMANVEDLKADAREIETLETAHRTGVAQEKQLREDMRRLLVDGWLAPLSAKLSFALTVVQARNDAAETHRREVDLARDRVEVLRKQMEGGTCKTCRQQLPPPSAETEHQLANAEAELKRLQDAGELGADIQRERLLQRLIDTSTVKAYRDKNKQLDELLTAQYERKRRIDQIKDHLKDHDAASIRQLGNKQDQLEKNIDSYAASLRDLDDQLIKNQADQNKLARDLQKLGGSDNKVAAEAYFFQYVQELTGRTIERYQERTRATVEARATDMFMKLIRDPEGYDGIKIERDYRVDLVGKRGPAMRTSEGGRQLIALSLIGALKQAAVRGGPMVLDSPLGRLDEMHSEHVLQRWLPELGNQAILLVQSKELNEQEAAEVLGNRIGRSYRIIRPNKDPEEATIERTH